MRRTKKKRIDGAYFSFKGEFALLKMIYQTEVFEHFKIEDSKTK